MLPKIIIVLALFAVIVSLGFALYFLMNDKREKKRTATALAVRVSISIGIIVFLLVANHFGWIHPHGVYGAR